jgi:hypothetical protein
MCQRANDEVWDINISDVSTIAAPGLEHRALIAPARR